MPGQKHRAERPALPPAHYSRGQITWFETTARLAYPVAGHGYAVTGPAGQLLCGASSQPGEPPSSNLGTAAGVLAPADALGDGHAAPRDSDHQFNLQRLEALTGITPPSGAVLHGRVGWRHLTADRLPLVGPVPSPMQAQAQHIERLRDVAHEPNLWVLAGLGGRGFTWAPLLGEVVAALASAGPLPMEAGLLDAADPSRHWLRQARRRAAG